MLRSIVRLAQHLEPIVTQEQSACIAGSIRTFAAAAQGQTSLLGRIRGAFNDIFAPNLASTSPRAAPAVGSAPSKDDKGDKSGGEEPKKSDNQVLAEMDIDGYKKICSDHIGSHAPPRPRFPPVPPSHPEYKMFVDLERAGYMRCVQHERIIGMLTAEEKAKINSADRDIQDDKAFIKSIAARQGLYIEDEIKDCIRVYFENKLLGQAALRWTEYHKRPAPTSRSGNRRMHEEMKAEILAEEKKEKLKKRDIDNCPVLPILSWSGPATKCDLTGLKFSECCGARQEGLAVPGLRQKYVPSMMKKQVPMRGRNAPAHDNIRRRMRKGMEDIKFEK